MADAVLLAEATVRLWDYAGNACQGKFFRLTQPEFTTWKTENQVARILQEDIQQDPSGLHRLTRYWTEKIPQMSRCTRRIHESINDAGNQRRYPADVRGHWYAHVLNDDLPPDSADREWVDLINGANQGWKEATEFLIEKRNRGRTMIEDEVSYQQASVEATTLLGDMYTEEIIHIP